jgi:hypothetical protein
MYAIIGLEELNFLIILEPMYKVRIAFHVKSPIHLRFIVHNILEPVLGQPSKKEKRNTTMIPKFW